MVFHVKYRDNKGKVVSDVFQAPNKAIVFAQLQQKGVLPLEIIEQQEGIAYEAPKEEQKSHRGFLLLWIVAVGLVVGGVVGVRNYISSSEKQAQIERERIEQEILRKVRKEQKAETESRQVRQHFVAQSSHVKEVREEVREPVKEETPTPVGTSQPVERPVEQETVQQEVSEEARPQRLSLIQRSYGRMTEEERFERLRLCLTVANNHYQSYTSRMMSDEQVRKMSASERAGYESDLGTYYQRYERAQKKVDDFVAMFSQDELSRFEVWAKTGMLQKVLGRHKLMKHERMLCSVIA